MQAPVRSLVLSAAVQLDPFSAFPAQYLKRLHNLTPRIVKERFPPIIDKLLRISGLRQLLCS